MGEHDTKEVDVKDDKSLVARCLLDLVDVSKTPERNTRHYEIFADVLRRHEPWRKARHQAAREHLVGTVVPAFVSTHGLQPQWCVLGSRIFDHAITYDGSLLTPILTVGAARLGGELSLVEWDLAIFNHYLAPSVTFDTAAFDAGLALAAVTEAVVNLDPVIVAFDAHLRSRGLRGAGLGADEEDTWNAPKKLFRHENI